MEKLISIELNRKESTVFLTRNVINLKSIKFLQCLKMEKCIVHLIWKAIRLLSKPIQKIKFMESLYFD